MSLKRSFNQVSRSPQIPTGASSKRCKNGLNPLNGSHHPGSFADFLPQPSDQVHTSATIPSYDFSEFGAPLPHVTDTQDSATYPFLEFLGNGSEFSPTPPQSYHVQSHPQTAVGSSASSSVGSVAASPVQGLAPTVNTALPVQPQGGNRKSAIYQDLRHPQPESHAMMQPSIGRHQPSTAASPQQDEKKEDEATPTLNDTQGSHVTQEQQRAAFQPTSQGQEANSSDTTAVEDTDEAESSRRAADRAARNRESSRRAREKAKGRLKALENDNHALREMNRRQRVQIESLAVQIHHLQRSSCNVCGYGMSSVAPAQALQHTYMQDQQSVVVAPPRRWYHIKHGPSWFPVYIWNFVTSIV